MVDSPKLDQFWFAQFDFLEKILEIISLPHFFWSFFLKNKKSVSHVIFYQLTKFHHLIGFTSWDVDQYAYVNCLFSEF